MKMRIGPGPTPQQQPKQPSDAHTSKVSPTGSRWPQRALDVLVRGVAPWMAPIVLRGSRNEYGPAFSAANGAPLPDEVGLEPPRGAMALPASRRQRS